MKIALLAAIAVFFYAGAAWPQDKPFAAGGPTVSLAVTGTTGVVQVQSGANNPALRVYNSGTVAVFLNCGGSAVTATVAAGMPVAPGSVEILGSAQTHCAAISGGTAVTLYLTPGAGL